MNHSNPFRESFWLLTKGFRSVTVSAMGSNRKATCSGRYPKRYITCYITPFLLTLLTSMKSEEWRLPVRSKQKFNGNVLHVFWVKKWPLDLSEGTKRILEHLGLPPNPALDHCSSLHIRILYFYFNCKVSFWLVSVWISFHFVLFSTNRQQRPWG